MRAPYQILIPLLSLFLVRVDLTDLFPITMQINLLKVYDGDTLLVEKGNFTYKVRLSRIDAPELGQPFLLANRDAGDYSRLCLKRLAKKSGTLIIYGFDMYGRILGDVDDLSLKMVQQGCAPLYPYAGFRSKAEKFYFIRQLQMAKRKKKGLWSLGGIMQPKLYRKQGKHLKSKSQSSSGANKII